MVLNFSYKYMFLYLLRCKICGAGLRFEYNIVNSHLLNKHQMNFLEYKRRVAGGEWREQQDKEDEAVVSSQPDTTLAEVEEEQQQPAPPAVAIMPCLENEDSSPEETAQAGSGEEQQLHTVQCQLCGKQLTLPALHTHLELSHAMRLNESTGELEDLVEIPPALSGGTDTWQARARRRQRYEAQHFLLAGNTTMENVDEDSDTVRQLGGLLAAGEPDHDELVQQATTFLSNGWHPLENGLPGGGGESTETREAENDEDGEAVSAYELHNNGLESSANGGEEGGQESAVEYSDDPDAMCQQVCEICGEEALVLRNHTRSVHGLNIAQYRELYPAFKFSSQVHHRQR